MPLSILICSGALSTAWGKPDYYTLKLYGKPVGQVSIEHYLAQKTQTGQTSALVTEIHNTNHATRDGNPFALNEISQFREDPHSGQPLSFNYSYDLGEQRLLEAQGEFQDHALNLSLQRENTLSQGKAPIATEHFFFPDSLGMRQIYRQHFRDPKGSHFALQTLTLGMQPKVVNSEIRPGKKERIKLKHGKRQVVRQFEIKNPTNPNTGYQEWRDSKGKLYKAQSLGKDQMELVLAAVGDEPNKEVLDIVTDSAIVSNPISQPRITDDAVYCLTPTQGHSFDWNAIIPNDHWQHIQKMEDNQLYLSVTQQKPRDTSIEYPEDGPAEYLKDTPYLQSDDDDILHFAQQVVGKEKRAYFAAKKLQRWVYEHIEQKDLSLGFASAKETLLNRQGDCTEHAVLLSALTRSLGIPSRVAVGLIYLPHGNSQAGRFVYHMWTEIYLGDQSQGEWLPLDATLSDSPTDATHIKIADSALNDADDLINITQKVTPILGRVKIDVLKAMSRSQSLLDVEAAPLITASASQKIDLQDINLQNLSQQVIKRFRVELTPPSMSKESPDGLFTYGVEALAKGQYAEAQDYFQQAIEKSRKPLEFYRLGERLAAIEMYDFAKTAFQQAEEKDPGLKPLVQAWLSNYMPYPSLPDSLNQQFMQALSESGQDNAISLLKAVTEQAHDFAPAFRRLGEELNGEEGINALRQAVTIAPNDFRNTESLGDACMHQGQYANAIPAYQSALEILKRSEALTQSKADWLLNLEGKLDIAQAALQLNNNKQDVSGWLKLGQGLLLQKRQDEAAQAFQNALTLNPDSPEAEMLNYRMALQTSDWRTMESDKDKIATLANSNVQATGLLGKYQMRSRQYGQAINTLQRAIGMAPHQAEFYRTLAQIDLRLADLADDLAGVSGKNQSQHWISQAQEILYRGARNATLPADRQDLTVESANLLLKLGKTNEALQLANSLLSENPISGQAWSIKGQALLSMGQSNEAKPALETALLLNPNDVRVLIQLGDTIQAEGNNHALALEYYQKAYKADPYSQEAADALNRMITQLHSAAHRPANYWYLSDDEHDYLVQLLYQGKLICQQTLDYLKVLQTIPGRLGKIEYSAKGIIAAQQLHDQLAHIRQKSLSLSQSLQNNRVPARFRRMNDALLDTVNQQIATLDIGLNSGASLDHGVGNIPATDYKELLTEINKPQSVVLLGILHQLNNNLPVPVLDDLLAEARLDELAPIKQESTAIVNELGSKKEKDPPPPANRMAAQTKPNGSNDPKQLNGQKAQTVKGQQPANLPSKAEMARKIPADALKNISLRRGLPPSFMKKYMKPAVGP